MVEIGQVVLEKMLTDEGRQFLAIGHLSDLKIQIMSRKFN